MKEGVMSNLSHHREIQRLPPAVRQEASTFTLGVVMTGIFAFFIAGIASAFIYAKDTNPMQTAATAKPQVSAAAPVETTGSGAPDAK
jgi:hypothetical protein